MVLLALPPADHLLIERDRGQFVPSRRRRMMANVRAERLLKIPAEPSPELLMPGAAAQTRVVSMAGIRLGSWESARAFKGIICDDISEFESHLASHAVRSPSAKMRVVPTLPIHWRVVECLGGFAPTGPCSDLLAGFVRRSRASVAEARQAQASANE